MHTYPPAHLILAWGCQIHRCHFSATTAHWHLRSLASAGASAGSFWILLVFGWAIEKESASYFDLFSQFGKIIDGIFRDFPDRVLKWQWDESHPAIMFFWELHHRKWGLRWLKHSETGILRQYKTMSIISVVFIDGIGPISDHHSGFA